MAPPSNAQAIQLPQTVNPRSLQGTRYRSTTPPEHPPAKRGRVSSGSPRKAPGRSRATPASYRYAGSQIPNASTSSNQKGKGRAQYDEGTDDKPIWAGPPRNFHQRIGEWKEAHSDDGWHEVMRIMQRNMHHRIIETFSIPWDNKSYDTSLNDAVATYREKHPELANPMDCPFAVMPFFLDFFADN